jgi:peptidoglycan-associated lipoprotein
MRSFLFFPASLLLIVACSHTQPPPPAPAAIVIEEAPAPAAPPPPAPELAVVVVAPPLTSASVYFDYDTSDLTTEARAALQAFVDQAQVHPDQGVRIEGNCDERGTREYNIALGQKRADAAKKYLADLGLDAARITTVSYGEERPRASGHDEAAWKENRRADLIPGSKNAVDRTVASDGTADAGQLIVSPKK